MLPANEQIVALAAITPRSRSILDRFWFDATMDHNSCGSMSHRTPDARIACIASRRVGVFTRSEALEVGASPRVIDYRLHIGRWEPLHPGVYRIAGATPGSWRQAIVAACLAAGPPAVASYRAAGRVWAFVDGQALEVTVLRGRRLRLRGVVAHEAARLDPVDVTTKDDIPVTSPTRTVIDLAGVLAEDELEEVLDDALRRGLTTPRRIRWRLEQLGNRRGSATLRRLLDARDPRAAAPKSRLETRVLRAMRRGGLPMPERQFPIRHRGRVIGIVDFAYPDAKLAIEADGYRWHSGRRRWEHDLGRRNALTALGWRVLHVTAQALERDPGVVVETIAAALKETGAVEPGRAPARTPSTRGSIL